MKGALLAASSFGLLGAAGLVAWSTLSRPVVTRLSSAQAESFDLKEAPHIAIASRSVAAQPAAAAVPSSPRPIPLAGMAVDGASAPAGSAAARPLSPPAAAPERLRWARHNRLLEALLRAPGRVLAAHSVLGSPRALRGFLSDAKRVDAYLDSPLIRVALNSPVVTKLVLGNPGLVRVVLGSPALRDPSSVRALLSSPMLRKMLDCPGVQGALADRDVIRNLATDPATASWLAGNPQALAALAGMAPALARSLGAG
ncbi:MAG: hypothetical protein KGM24_02865 [Elusimicrobia bacterium]|nr:hypothetical protein [Elusimicrobiota bacterium]